MLGCRRGSSTGACRNVAATVLAALLAGCGGILASSADGGATIPSAPTNVIAIAGNQSASLTWAVPSSTGGSPITGYSIVTSPPAPSAQIVVSGTSAFVTALTNGTPYKFTVAALNAVGTGPASLPSPAVTPTAPAPNLPSAPGSVTATPGVGSVNLTWTVPSSDGGSPLVGYTVSISPATPSAVVVVTGTTASVTGLTNGTTYTFTVAASNIYGTGQASSSSPVTTFSVPDAPTDVVAAAGDQSASLTWTAPTSTGGSPITGYSIVISPPAPSAQIVVSGTSASVTALTNGTPYTFTVAAVNAVGTGAASLPSPVVTPMAPAPDVPSAPGSVTANPGVGSVNLSWTVPTSDGGSPILGYTVSISLATPSAVVVVIGTTASVTGLANGATYTFTVSAFNAVGAGPNSAASVPVTTLDVPDAPTNVVAVAGDQSASLTWAAPASTGGSPIMGYSIVISPPAPPAQIVVSGTSGSVIALTNGTPYTFTVAAVNAVGTGPASLPSPVVTPMAPAPNVPSAPGSVTANPGVGSVNLSWTVPTSDGGSPITGYAVTTYPSTPSAIVTVSGMTASVTGLTDGTTYTFTVAASNVNGTGQAASSGPVTTFSVPDAPTNVVAVAGDQSASLTWTAPASTGGSPVTGYSIVISPPAPSTQIVVSGTSASVTALTNGTPYTFTAAAVNAVGTGPASLPSPAVTPTLPPSGLTYATNPAVYTVGTAIAVNAPSSSGGAVASYAVSPALPAGLSLNQLSGVISGTPMAVTATTTYTVTATNSGGSTTAGLSITVNLPVPALAQRRAFGAMAPGRGLSPASSFTIRLQNPVLAGNCLVLFMDYSSGITVSSITDDANNAWSAAPAVTANAGSGKNKTEAYVLPNANAGARNFTITFSAALNNVHFILLEYYNVATSAAVGVTTSSTTAQAPTITLPSLTPTAGSLVLHYSMDNAGPIAGSGTASVTSFTAGSGWTLEAADYASGNSGGPVAISFFALQTLIAPGGSVTPTVTTTGKNTVNSIALELIAAPAGTPPPAGIRVLRMQDYLNPNINVATWSEPFPSSGNLLVVMESNGDITSVISDSNANAWVMAVKGVDSDVVSLNYAPNHTTSSTLVMHWPITGTARNTTVTAYDITGADPANPYVQSVTSAPTAISGPFTGQPIITPQRANGVVLVVCGDGIGPITALTQPAGAYYLSSNYPGEVDNDTIDNADGYAINYYGTNLATQNYGWTIHTGGNSVNATGVEFATGTSP